MVALFIERENEILRVMRSFADAGLEFVVVGGYAVSGLEGIGSRSTSTWS